jgi:hypothetical protein
MIYLGLDQALANTGWCLVDFFNNEIRTLKYGILITNPGDTLYYRLSLIELNLHHIMTIGTVNKIYTENVYINHRRPAASRNLVRVETIVHRLAYKLDIPVEIIKSGKEDDSWKKLLNCPGKQEAKQLFSPLLNKQGKKYTDSDGVIIPGSLIINCTDAMAITFAGLIKEYDLTKELLLDQFLHRSAA